MKNLKKILAIFIIASLLTGCAQLKEKFTKKKKPEKVTPVIEVKDYSKELKVDKLYDKHFTFWKYWHDELINNLGGNIKKQKRCYNESLVELKAMASYLQQQKQKKLRSYIDKFKKLESKIKDPVLTQNEEHNLKRHLKKYKRVVDRKFSLSKVESWLVKEPE